MSKELVRWMAEHDEPREFLQLLESLTSKWERDFVDPTDEERSAWAAEDSRLALVERRRTLLDRGIPEKDLANLLGDSLGETRALVQAKRFWNDSRLVLLVLSGEKGCGKTTAASWVVAQDPAGMMITVSQLSRMGLYDDAKFGELSRARTLVIDDLGMEFVDQKGAFLALLDAVVDDRYRNQRKTVITTNLNAQGFIDRYGQRVADRIRESGVFVGLTDKSLRSVK